MTGLNGVSTSRSDRPIAEHPESRPVSTRPTGVPDSTGTPDAGSSGTGTPGVPVESDAPGTAPRGAVEETTRPGGGGLFTPTGNGGAGLLEQLRGTLREYVVFPGDDAATAVTLWIAASFGQRAWQHAPRLVITGPTKRCGKSRLLDVVHESCWQPLITVNASVAAVFRSIGDDPPTLLVDEADTLFGTAKAAESHEELRGLLNAGHQRNRPTLRVVGVGTEQKVKPFSTFAMAALAGIGAMPDTIMDRAVVVSMRRRAPGEVVKPFRTRRDAPRLHTLRRQLAAWLRDRTDQLAEIEPDMPLEDRAADTWEPLIIVADLAGGDWPEAARQAAESMVATRARDDADSAVSVRLLADLRELFGDAPALHGTTILTRLHAIDEAPWAEWSGRALTARDLARLLKPYGVTSTKVKIQGEALQGYRREQLHDAWSRYLPPSPLGAGTSGTSGTVQVNGTLPVPVPLGHPEPEPATPHLTSAVPEVPQVPEPSACAVCGQPMRLLEPGQTTHPGCDRKHPPKEGTRHG